MRAHWRYLVRFLKWKWHILRAGIHVGAPLWRLLIHDWGRLGPSVWFPYARFLYGPTSDAQAWMAAYLRREYGVTLLEADAQAEEFAKRDYSAARKVAETAYYRAKLRLNHRSRWSWTWHILRDETKPTADALEMPEWAVRIQVADWLASGKDQNGKFDVPMLRRWYAQKRENVKMHLSSRKLVERVLNEATIGDGK